MYDGDRAVDRCLIGFGYGYTGEHGQWWTDQALVLDPPVATRGSAVTSSW